MPRYPRGARRPRKPWKGTTGPAHVFGGPSIYSTPLEQGAARWRNVMKKADENRKNLTPAESKFQQILFRLKIKHKSQYVVSGKYILDFYLWDSKIGIEIDGESHGEPLQRRKDREKERECRKKGIQLIRYSNSDVYQRSDEIAKDLVRRTNNPSDVTHFPKPNLGKPINEYVSYEDALAALRARGGGSLRRAPNGGWSIGK